MKEEITRQLHNVIMANCYQKILQFCIDYNLPIQTIYDKYCRTHSYQVIERNSLTIHQSSSQEPILLLSSLTPMHYQQRQFWIDSQNRVYQQKDHFWNLVGIYNPELSLLYYS